MKLRNLILGTLAAGALYFAGKQLYNAADHDKDPKVPAGYEQKIPTGSLMYRRTGEDSLESRINPQTGKHEFVYVEEYQVRFTDGTAGLRRFERPVHSPQEHEEMYGKNGPRHGDDIKSTVGKKALVMHEFSHLPEVDWGSYQRKDRQKLLLEGKLDPVSVPYDIQKTRELVFDTDKETGRKMLGEQTVYLVTYFEPFGFLEGDVRRFKAAAEKQSPVHVRAKQTAGDGNLVIEDVN